MKKTIISLVLIFSVILSSNGQENRSIKAANTYVRFANESTHGLLIIHRLLEIFNQELNKYVDIPSYDIAVISNEDLPKNVFVDSDHWFYDVTPSELFQQIKKEKFIIGENNYNVLFPIASNISKVCNNINSKRIDIANLLGSVDLNKKSNLEKLYEALEEQVDNYDLYFAYILDLEAKLKDMYPNTNLGNLKPLINIYNAAIPILPQLRYNKDVNKKDCVSRLQSALNKVKGVNDVAANKYKGRIFKSIKEIIGLIKTIGKNQKIDKVYQLYGSNYYNYNIVMLSKFNRYGNGFVNSINKILTEKKLNTLQLFEYPHYYKVIYPKKMPETAKLVTSSLKKIESIPKKVNNRTINNVGKNVINVDKQLIEIELFDYKIQDGDIVSINYNGDWIYKNISLETKPKKLKIKINKEGKNYILLHAENVGRRPPNTIGINIYKDDKKETFILQSDMEKTDLIEINFRQ